MALAGGVVSFRMEPSHQGAAPVPCFDFIVYSDSVSTYSAVTAQSLNLSKEHAIVFDSVSNFTVKDYTVALGKVIGPGNIRFSSRISQSRICFYLASKELVRKTVDIGEFKLLNEANEEHTVEARPLISQAKRVTISNVKPEIPNSFLEEILKKLNIRSKSRVTHVRAGYIEAGYNHILSFRRQVYIDPRDEDKIPPAINVKTEDALEWIYFSSNKIKCFVCHQEGHLAKSCKEKNDSQNHVIVDTLVSSNSSNYTLQINTDNDSTLRESLNVNDNIVQEPNNLAISALPNAKRELSDTSSCPSVSSQTPSTVVTSRKTKKSLKPSSKKLKIDTHSLEEIKQNLSPLKSCIDSAEKSIL